MNSFAIEGQVVDILGQKIYPAIVSVVDGIIQSMEEVRGDYRNAPFILPGFIDAHVHIESSMLIPSEFARLAVVHGTIATISDPHEIANVCGVKGIEYMIEDGNTVPFHFFFGAPSCVPATMFETAGAGLNVEEVEKLLQKKDIKYLSEMMNFPGVLTKDTAVMQKIAAAHRLNKPVDGHAPGLMGAQAQQYINAGISTDHECFTKEEALDKLKYGMHILIREGSAAKNFEALIDLVNDFPEKIMFCSDDKHPDSLAEGHINQLCERAVQKGISVFKILRAACINPVLHYKLETGLLREGDPADFVVVRDLKRFEPMQTYISGELVAENGETLIGRLNNERKPAINNFSCTVKSSRDFSRPYALALQPGTPVIEALNGQLITNKWNTELFAEQVDIEHDILKIAVVNRYADQPIAIAYIKNFGLKRGSIASSVAHDSHNIVAIGVDDESICEAVNMIIRHKGGISLFSASEEMILPLPVAGLMSMEDGYTVAKQYAAMDKVSKAMGSALSSPYMTLSFMSLLVIPHLKLSDKGLFDGDLFQLIQ